MMTREEFLETSNSRLAAEALLTQYDVKQSQQKIDAYIGNYSTMREYLEVEFSDISHHLDFEKLAAHKLEKELFSIEYKDRIYLFKQHILSIKYEDLKESENLEMIKKGNTILMPNSKFKVLNEDSSIVASLMWLGGAFDNGSKKGLRDYFYGLTIEVENEKKEKETFDLGYQNRERMELKSYEGYELEEDCDGFIYNDYDFKKLREFCEEGEEILELINKKAHEKSKEMLIDLLEEKLEKLKKLQDGDVKEDSELIDKIIDDVESQLEDLKLPLEEVD